MCDETEAMIRTGGDLLRLPEFLTTRGRCLARVNRVDDAERSFAEAIELARAQNAWSGELRASLALAELRMAQGRGGDVPALLRAFVAAAQGEDSLDLRQARALLLQCEDLEQPAS
jgi:hypothetical protein